LFSFVSFVAQIFVAAAVKKKHRAATAAAATKLAHNRQSEGQQQETMRQQQPGESYSPLARMSQLAADISLTPAENARRQKWQELLAAMP
jgi:hypothetical protein